MASTHSQTPRSRSIRTAPEARSGVLMAGTSARENSTADVAGASTHTSARYCQCVLPNANRNSVANRIKPTTPQAYTECSLLTSRSGFSDGMAAMTGLISTSVRPPDAANSTVPSTRPAYTACGNRMGQIP